MKYFSIALVALSTSAAAADNDPVFDLFKIYAEHLGTLTACDLKDRKPEIEEVAGLLADHEYPGFFAKFGDEKKQYYDRMTSAASYAYLNSRLEGCPSIFQVSVTETLANAAGDALRNLASN